MEVICFHCQKVNSSQNKIGFRDECFGCRSDLHVCKNCEFYDIKSYNECREPSAEVVRDKERVNLCEFFLAKNKDQGMTGAKENIKALAEALFKNSSKK